LQWAASTAGSPLAQCGALFVTPFLHEDVAIVAAALLIVGHRLSLGWALASLAAGMVARDLTIYGLGAAARKSGIARRLLIGPRVQRLADWLGGNLTSVVVAGRLVPGLMYPAYIACGWFRLPFAGYALRAIALTVLYLPTVLTLAYFFGQAALTHVGSWAWILPAVPIVMAVMLQHRPFRKFLARIGLLRQQGGRENLPASSPAED
jgi:membrane protein DedA with SNARE-associated domain